MSVIVVKKTDKKIVIGADSIRVTYWTQEKDKSSKLSQISDGFIIGSSGLCSEYTLLCQFAQNHTPKHASADSIVAFMTEFLQWYRTQIGDAAKMLENMTLIVYKGKVFYFNNYFCREVTDYYAVGAGMDFALTALCLGHTVEKALEVACELSVFCEKPLNIIEVEL